MELFNNLKQNTNMSTPMLYKLVEIEQAVIRHYNSKYNRITLNNILPIVSAIKKSYPDHEVKFSIKLKNDK